MGGPGDDVESAAGRGGAAHLPELTGAPDAGRRGGGHRGPRPVSRADGLGTRGTQYFQTSAGIVWIDDSVAHFQPIGGPECRIEGAWVVDSGGNRKRSSVATAEELQRFHDAMGNVLTPMQGQALASLWLAKQYSNGQPGMHDTPEGTMVGPTLRLGSALYILPDGKTLLDPPLDASGQPVDASARATSAALGSQRAAAPQLSPDLLFLMTIDCFLSTTLAMLLLTAGIALLAGMRFGAGLHKLYASLKLAAVALTAALVLEQADQLGARRAPNGYLFGIVLGVGLFYAIYPIVLLLFLRRVTFIGAYLKETGAAVLVPEESRTPVDHAPVKVLGPDGPNGNEAFRGPCRCLRSAVLLRRPMGQRLVRDRPGVLHHWHVVHLRAVRGNIEPGLAAGKLAGRCRRGRGGAMTLRNRWTIAPILSALLMAGLGGRRALGDQPATTRPAAVRDEAVALARHAGANDPDAPGTNLTRLASADWRAFKDHFDPRDPIWLELVSDGDFKVRARRTLHLHGAIAHSVPALRVGADAAPHAARADQRGCRDSRSLPNRDGRTSVRQPSFGCSSAGRMECGVPWHFWRRMTPAFRLKSSRRLNQLRFSDGSDQQKLLQGAAVQLVHIMDRLPVTNENADPLVDLFLKDVAITPEVQDALDQVSRQPGAGWRVAHVLLQGERWPERQDPVFRGLECRRSPARLHRTVPFDACEPRAEEEDRAGPRVGFERFGRPSWRIALAWRYRNQPWVSALGLPEDPAGLLREGDPPEVRK